MAMGRSFIDGLLSALGFKKSVAEEAPAPAEAAPIMALAPLRPFSDPAAQDWFWHIVDASSDADQAAQTSKFRAALDKLSDQDLVDFIGLYWGLDSRLSAVRLWAAAYLMNGGCSDDGFTDFRAWLIAQGRMATERALADPDSLAELGVELDSASFEDFGYVMYHSFRDRSGGAYPTFRSTEVSNDPTAPDWKFDFEDDEQMRQRLPRLAASYL
jgi:hypothetical protein